MYKLEIINLSQEKRLYGLKIYDTVFLATLVDLPCIIEAMKTLDFTNFFKSQDASQMLYVHSKKITNFTDKSADEINQIINDFDPIVEDPGFLQNLYERKKLLEKHAEVKMKNEERKQRVEEELRKRDEEKVKELFGSEDGDHQDSELDKEQADSKKGSGQKEKADKVESQVNDPENLEKGDKDAGTMGKAGEDQEMKQDGGLRNENEEDQNEYAFANETLKFRHGISPVTYNIRSIRYKRKPDFDKEQVGKVESILKDLIDFGFAKHVEEQLLRFN